jgi:SAM-dependent methyltransferase
MTSAYLMESQSEAQRLELKTDADETRRQLALTGLRAGMRALDAGAGTGAVARVMAEAVGSKGSVVAFDGSAERLAAGAQASSATNLSFVAGDLYAPALPEGSFDFIWCRFVFEYLAEPDRALSQLQRLLKPGGKLVVGDLDGNTVFHHPMPPEVESGLARLMRALEGRFDPFAGRKLFHRFRRAGLADVRVHMLPYHLYAGTAPERDMLNWEAKFRTVREAGARAFGSHEAYDRFGARFLEMLRDPDAFTYSTLFLVEGIRANADSACADPG